MVHVSLHGKPLVLQTRPAFIPEGAAARRIVKQPMKLKGLGMIPADRMEEEEPRARTLRDLELELGNEYSTDMRSALFSALLKLDTCCAM